MVPARHITKSLVMKVPTLSHPYHRKFLLPHARQRCDRPCDRLLLLPHTRQRRDRPRYRLLSFPRDCLRLQYLATHHRPASSHNLVIGGMICILRLELPSRERKFVSIEELCFAKIVRKGVMVK